MRNTKKKSDFSNESAALRFFYGTAVGRFLLRGIVGRWFSVLAGKVMDMRISKGMIKRFVRKNHIDLSQYQAEEYRCFNDFFCRKIRPELRPIEQDPGTLIAPCDGLVSVYPVNGDTVIPVKQSLFSVSSLLRDDPIAKEYENGFCFVFRLCVNHYHRYCYPVTGTKSENRFLPGKLHTVRPIALAALPVFCENCREYTVMEDETFGKLTQVEVGALLVGKIKNLHGAGSICRGDEKGMFLYGGSTVILLVSGDRVRVPNEWTEATRRGEEIPVQMGQPIGWKIETETI